MRQIAGLLSCADSREGRAWIITDSRRRNAQAAPDIWPTMGAHRRMKAWTLPGSQAAWPIGLREASSFSAIALVEGGPDLLAALHLAWCAGVEDRVAPVAMLGASNRDSRRCLAVFRRKTGSNLPAR